MVLGFDDDEMIESLFDEVQSQWPQEALLTKVRDRRIRVMERRINANSFRANSFT